MGQNSQINPRVCGLYSKSVKIGFSKPSKLTDNFLCRVVQRNPFRLECALVSEFIGFKAD